MRKTIWGTTIALVVIASGAYLALQYGVRNPNSWVGRVIGGASSVGIKASPLVAIRGFRPAPADEQEQQKREPNEKANIPVDPRRDTRIIEPIVVEMPEPAANAGFNELEPNGFVPPEVVANRQAWDDFERTQEFMPYAVEDQAKKAEKHGVANAAVAQNNKTKSKSWFIETIERVSRFLGQREEVMAPKNATPQQDESRRFKAFEFTPFIDWVVPNRTQAQRTPESGAESPAGQLPASQIDRGYHHQHPECPYLGGYRRPGAPTTPQPK